MYRKAATLIFTTMMALQPLNVAAGINYLADQSSGAIKSIKIDTDSTGMNWTISPDKTQYPWIGASDGWGLGYFRADGKEHRWTEPTYITADKSVAYLCGDITITVSRKKSGGDLIENYKFTNTGAKSMTLSDIGILTPFNDNYPDARTCINSRCHAHIWAGGNTAYVYALRMGAYGPHIGLVLTRGSISDYEIWHRGNDKGNSQTRGIIALCPDDMALNPGESETLEWRIFAHEGKDDFCNKASRLGCHILTADSYLVAPGQKVAITDYSGKTETVTIPPPPKETTVST